MSARRRLARWACRRRSAQCLLCARHIRGRRESCAANTPSCRSTSLPQLDDASTANPYFWARFAQPAAIVYAADDGTSIRLRSCRRHWHFARHIGECRRVPPGDDADPQSLAAALREHLCNRASSRTPQSRARDLSTPIATTIQTRRPASRLEPAIESAKWHWRRADRARSGPSARLVKAAFTFSGGADYLAWKIERHSGHKIDAHATGSAAIHSLAVASTAAAETSRRRRECAE